MTKTIWERVCVCVSSHRQGMWRQRGGGGCLLGMQVCQVRMRTGEGEEEQVSFKWK